MLFVLLSPGIVPTRKLGSGASKKTLPRMDKLLKHKESLYRFITVFELKNKHPELHYNVSKEFWSAMLPCSQEAQAHSSNAEENAQLLLDIYDIEQLQREENRCFVMKAFLHC